MKYITYLTFLSLKNNCF